MKQKIEREYVLTVDEVKAALRDYLKKIDRPAPPTPEAMSVSWNAPGEAFIRFTEFTDFDRVAANEPKTRGQPATLG